MAVQQTSFLTKDITSIELVVNLRIPKLLVIEIEPTLRPHS